MLDSTGVKLAHQITMRILKARLTQADPLSRSKNIERDRLALERRSTRSSESLTKYWTAKVYKIGARQHTLTVGTSLKWRLETAETLFWMLRVTAHLYTITDHQVD
jgi:hypothetical protein